MRFIVTISTLALSSLMCLAGVGINGGGGGGSINGGGSGGNGSGTNSYTLPPATTNSLGGVIPDGTTITVDGTGKISAVGGGGSVSIDISPVVPTVLYTNTSGSNLTLYISATHVSGTTTAQGGEVDLQIVNGALTNIFSTFELGVTNLGTRAELSGMIKPNGWYFVTTNSPGSILSSERVYTSIGGGGSGGSGTNLLQSQLDKISLAVTNLNSPTNITYFVAYWGNDSTNGLSDYAPLATLNKASLITSNLAVTVGGSYCIRMMDGVNMNELASPARIILQNKVALQFDAGAQLYITNFQPIVKGAIIRLGPNTINNGINLYMQDGNSGNMVANTAIPIGFDGGADAASSLPIMTNIVVNNLQLISESQGVHFENNTGLVAVVVTFNGGSIKARNNCFQNKCPFSRITLNGLTFEKTNGLATTVSPAKPDRVFDVSQEATNITIVNGGMATYSDSPYANAAATYCFYSEAVSTNQIIVDNFLLNPINMTNVLSGDVSTSGGGSPATPVFQLNSGVRRVDGNTLIEFEPSGSFSQVQQGPNNALTTLSTIKTITAPTLPIVFTTPWTNTYAANVTVYVDGNVNTVIGGTASVTLTNLTSTDSHVIAAMTQSAVNADSFSYPYVVGVNEVIELLTNTTGTATCNITKTTVKIK